MIGVNAFLDASPGLALEIKLNVIWSRPGNLEEAVAHATEADAVLEVENKTARRKGDVWVVRSTEDPLEEVKKLKGVKRRCP